MCRRILPDGFEAFSISGPTTPLDSAFLHPLSFQPLRLCGGDGLPGANATLPAVEVLLACDNLRGLLDDLLTLGKDQLDVARVGHVRVDLN